MWSETPLLSILSRTSSVSLGESPRLGSDFGHRPNPLCRSDRRCFGRARRTSGVRNNVIGASSTCSRDATDLSGAYQCGRVWPQRSSPISSTCPAAPEKVFPSSGRQICSRSSSVSMAGSPITDLIRRRRSSTGSSCRIESASSPALRRASRHSDRFAAVTPYFAARGFQMSAAERLDNLAYYARGRSTALAVAAGFRSRFDYPPGSGRRPGIRSFRAEDTHSLSSQISVQGSLGAAIDTLLFSCSNSCGLSSMTVTAPRGCCRRATRQFCCVTPGEGVSASIALRAPATAGFSPRVRRSGSGRTLLSSLYEATGQGGTAWSSCYGE